MLFLLNVGHQMAPTNVLKFWTNFEIHFFHLNLVFVLLLIDSPKFMRVRELRGENKDIFFIDDENEWFFLLSTGE